MIGLLRGVWTYRYFIANSVWNEFYGRFVRSGLGGLWIVLQPLSQVLIYALILSHLLASKIPNVQSPYGYAIYLMAGMLGWNLFSEILDRSLKIFIAHANIIKKVSFPRVTLPVIAAGSALVNNGVLFAVMTLIFLALGHTPTWHLLYIFPLMAVTVLFASGIGLILGIVNVFVRDIEQLVPIILQVLFWFTPIVYPDSIIPHPYRHFMTFNPMFFLVEAYHRAIVYQTPPNIGPIVVILVVSLALCVLALLLFRRANAELVDAL